jgi:hypothetical protein
MQTGNDRRTATLQLASLALRLVELPLCVYQSELMSLSSHFVKLLQFLCTDEYACICNGRVGKQNHDYLTI